MSQTGINSKGSFSKVQEKGHLPINPIALQRSIWQILSQHVEKDHNEGSYC